MINPHNSPWFQPPKPQWINDPMLYRRWAAIKQHLKGRAEYRHQYDQLWVNNEFVIAKRTQKMRLISHLDWASYTPQTLAQAMDLGQVAVYYEQRLKHPDSDPNLWQDQVKEMDLKTHYAVRVGRANKI